MKILFWRRDKNTERKEAEPNPQVTNYVNASVSQIHDDDILKLLTLFERANHYVKDGGWYEIDKSELYSLKDQFLTKFYKNKPEGVEIELLYVPYLKYSSETKDKAGDMMRADANKQPFEFYLSQIQPCAKDIEVPGKATIEMLISYKGRTWCFHMPEQLTSSWGVDVNRLKRKVWVNSRDFHSQQFKLIKAEAESLLSKL
ncbi:MAG: hypothetical protein IKH26_03525 [Bacteroidaceae bacterium]|nr:hypothetical protein [Bacteroidaceae bacterium]